MKDPTTQTRLPFEVDVRAEAGALTAHSGGPLLIEAFRTSGTAGVPDASVVKTYRIPHVLPRRSPTRKRIRDQAENFRHA